MNQRSIYDIRTEVLHWDGRLDNRDDLLLRLGDSLRGYTSNEAIARAVYERWGSEGLVHLIGDWSLVIRDRVNRMTVLASDFAVDALRDAMNAGADGSSMSASWPRMRSSIGRTSCCSA